MLLCTHHQMMTYQMRKNKCICYFIVLSLNKMYDNYAQYIILYNTTQTEKL